MDSYRLTSCTNKGEPRIKAGSKRFMINSMTGIIAAATAIKRFQKKDGTVSEQATIHVRQVTDDRYPLEVAVKLTGEQTQYARMIGASVEVQYVIRVFTFVKNGETMLGNDIYARMIRLIPGEEVLALPAHPTALALPAHPAPKGCLPMCTMTMSNSAWKGGEE